MKKKELIRHCIQYIVHISDNNYQYRQVSFKAYDFEDALVRFKTKAIEPEKCGFWNQGNHIFNIDMLNKYFDMRKNDKYLVMYLGNDFDIVETDRRDKGYGFLTYIR